MDQDFAELIASMLEIRASFDEYYKTKKWILIINFSFKLNKKKFRNVFECCNQ